MLKNFDDKTILAIVKQIDGCSISGEDFTDAIETLVEEKIDPLLTQAFEEGFRAAFEIIAEAAPDFQLRLVPDLEIFCRLPGYEYFLEDLDKCPEISQPLEEVFQDCIGSEDSVEYRQMMAAKLRELAAMFEVGIG